jgi:hypothetical protein
MPFLSLSTNQSTPRLAPKYTDSFLDILTGHGPVIFYPLRSLES